MGGEAGNDSDSPIVRSAFDKLVDSMLSEFSRNFDLRVKPLEDRKLIYLSVWGCFPRNAIYNVLSWAWDENFSFQKIALLSPPLFLQNTPRNGGGAINSFQSFSGCDYAHPAFMCSCGVRMDAAKQRGGNPSAG